MLLQCAFVISSDTAAGGRKCQYGFESAKAACEDKPESRPRNTRAAAVFALQRSRFSWSLLPIGDPRPAHGWESAVDEPALQLSRRLSSNGFQSVHSSTPRLADCTRTAEQRGRWLLKVAGGGTREVPLLWIMAMAALSPKASCFLPPDLTHPLLTFWSSQDWCSAYMQCQTAPKQTSGWAARRSSVPRPPSCSTPIVMTSLRSCWSKLPRATPGAETGRKSR